MKIKYLILFLAALASSRLSAQNLVINPSFESFTTCPFGPGQLNNYVQTWFQPYPSAPGCSTSDYFNGCSGPFAGVPVNMLGNQNALTGVAYAGIMLFENDPNLQCLGTKGDDYREYIEGTLSAPLTAGATYSVSFNINLPDDAMAASPDIGLYFSNSAINLPCPPPLTSTVLPYVNQLQYSGPAVTNTTGWTLIQWTYTAVGGEQYFIIGNFKNDASSSSICANAVSQNHFAYYFIDDVTVELTTPSTALSASTVGNNLLCNNQCNGTAAVTPINGTVPYTYLWNPGGQTSNVATGLCAGTYSVLVTDATNATTTSSVTITEPAALTASTTVTNTSCGQNTGAASVSPSGGTSPYTYLWSNGSTAMQITNLSAGNYSVTIADSHGCTQYSTVSVINLNGPSVNTFPTNTSCSAVSDGTGTATVSGGTSPYTYNWSNGQTTSVATALSAGNYTCVVTDAAGCTNAATINIINGSGPTANAGTNSTITVGSSSQLSASGGVTYSWSPAAGLNSANISNPVASPTTTTQYCVHVTDANGCADSACVTVAVIPEPLPCGEFFIPNAFSPNNDSENDIFKAYVLPSCVTEFKLVIYNRWGEIVFETTDVTKGWDGFFRTEISNTAVYAYYCNASFTNGNKVFKKGNVSLVR